MAFFDLLQSLKIENLYFGEGSDHTGVPTKLMSVNCSANLVIYNPATFFGIDVTSHTAHLKYLEVTVATGQVTYILKHPYLLIKLDQMMY